jgi:hypothetical protein
MSATIIPFRPRPRITAPVTSVYFPALIDGQVTVHALIEGLASVGLTLQREPTTGTFVIVARPDLPDEQHP